MTLFSPGDIGGVAVLSLRDCVSILSAADLGTLKWLFVGKEYGAGLNELFIKYPVSDGLYLLLDVASGLLISSLMSVSSSL